MRAAFNVATVAMAFADGRAAIGAGSALLGHASERLCSPLECYCPVHMLGTMRLHNASFPSGRTRELCLDFFAAVATLNSLRDANLWGRGSMFEQRRGS